MSVGSDGFTDCSYVCNPGNSMQWSCNNYCPGYKFVAPTSTTVQTTTLKVNPGTDMDAAVIVWIVYLCVGVILLTAIVIIICCCNKQRICTFRQKYRDKQLQYPTQPSDVERAANDTRQTYEAGATLPLVQPENGTNGNQATVPSENLSDSGVFVENSPVHANNEGGLDGNTAINSENGSLTSTSEHQDEDTSTQREDDGVTYHFVSEGDTVPKKLEEVSRLAVGQRMGYAGGGKALYAITDN